VGAPAAGTDDGEIAELRAEVTGLRQALESRGLIERAKGVLMHRHGWTADEAFQYLVRLSQHTNVRLAELAGRVVDEVASARGIASGDEAWAHRLLDLLTDPAMLLRPLPGRGDPAADFRIEYANPAIVASAGRPVGDIVGRRLSLLYPPPVSARLHAACRHALQPQPAARPTTGRLRALPLLNKILLTWAPDPLADSRPRSSAATPSHRPRPRAASSP
jgi:PAS domain-containing protein